MTDQIEALRVALGGRYRVEREAGSGGMATVYLARDAKHDRDVALKVLHPDLAASIGADRFLREIHITAGLQHPHVLPLYDSGEAGGLLYYVMPFVEGETLDQVLEREGQLPIREAVRYVREAAEALAYAHGHGLIHRDLKPGNIFISGGHAILADFGIARALEEAGSEKLTQTGTAVGTPAYMSPEQATGQVNLDARSDIYSLGCVLYEALVGQIPFTGRTPMAIMARHSADRVPPPHIMRDTISEELEEVIYRCLAKSPADRYRTAAELAEALKEVDASGTGARPRAAEVAWTTPYGARRARWRGWRPWVPAVTAFGALALVGVGWAMWPWGGPQGPPPPIDGLDPRRVAVLYFDDLSGGELAHVADGITEELIGQLREVRDLDVVSRNGVASVRNADLPRDSIARVLGAGSLILGAIEPVRGERIRVGVRLVDGASGADVERTSFELAGDALLAVGDSVGDEAARLLRSWLGEEIRLRERRAGTGSVAAWALLQRAERARKDAEARMHGGDAAGALSLLDTADSLGAEAEDLDERWAEPPVLRARAAVLRAQWDRDLLEVARTLRDGLDHAEKALERDPQNADALELRGTMRVLRFIRGLEPNAAAAERLLEAAEADLRRATAMNPAQAGAWNALVFVYNFRDDLVEANNAARRAYEADAYLANAPVILWTLYTTSYDLEQFSQARRWCDEGGRRFPENFRFTECRLGLLTTRAEEPNVTLAWELVERFVDLNPEPRREYARLMAQTLTAGVAARAGLPDSARAVLDRSRGTPEVDPSLDLVTLHAFVHTLLGDHETAVRLIGEFLTARPEHREGYATHLHWWWRPLQDYPEFRRVIGVSD